MQADPGGVAGAPTSGPHIARPAGHGVAPELSLLPPPHLSYFGGRVLSNVEVVAIFWGPSVNTTVTSTIPGFYSAVVNNPYVDWLSEYDTPTQTIGRGTFKGSFTIAPINTRSFLTDADIQAELIAQIVSGAVPPPNANTSYMIHFPPGFTLSDKPNSYSCTNFCAYHSVGNFAGACRTGWVCPPPRCTRLGCFQQPCYPTQTCDPASSFAYAVFPDLTDPVCNSGCGLGTPFANQTSAASHELVEAMTDPGATIAWRDPFRVEGEIGDLCNQQQATLPGTSFTVQREWDNASSSCIITTCVPACSGKCGGDNGCGGTCPDNCAPGLSCFHDACCLRKCAPDQCGGDDGCGGTCPNNCPTGTSCFSNLCCLPKCVGNCGGDDGCGGTCPSCCVPNCFGKLGGDDGCGHTCPF